MCFVAQPFGLGECELAFVDSILSLGLQDPQARLPALPRCRLSSDLVPGMKFFDSAVMPPSIVVRWTRNRCGVIRMQSKSALVLKVRVVAESRLIPEPAV
jgi:hypothetical protein